MKTDSSSRQYGKEKQASFSLVCSLLFVVLLLAGVTACSKRYHNLPAFSAFPVPDPANHSVGRFKTSYLADQIHAYFRGHISGPIAIATFVDVDNLYQSSTFGRILSEQLMGELSMRGYNVIEVRHADAMQVMFHNGEFGLSRETGVLKDMQSISALVVGTYAVSPVRVYLNTRVIDPRTSMVISAGSVEMGKTKEMVRLLRSGSFKTSLERIPVRHLGYSVYPAPYYWPNYGYGFPPPAKSESWWEEEEDNEKSMWMMKQDSAMKEKMSAEQMITGDKPMAEPNTAPSTPQPNLDGSS